jgi:hypothetical protein
MSEATPGAPSAAYLATMIVGLREAHGLSDEELTSYLGSAPGCSRRAVLDACSVVPGGGNGA